MLGNLAKVFQPGGKESTFALTPRTFSHLARALLPSVHLPKRSTSKFSGKSLVESRRILERKAPASTGRSWQGSWVIDAFIDRAVPVAWTSTPRHHVNVDGGSNPPRADEHTPVENMRLNS